MKKLLVTTSILLACILAGNIVPQRSSARETKFMRSVNAIPGRYIVVLRPSTKNRFELAGNSEAISYELAGEYGANVDRVYDTAILGFSAQMTEENAIELSKDDRVASVEEDAVVSLQSVQTSPPWSLDRLDQRNLPLNSAFQYSTSGSGVHAYIIDSGIRQTHQEFGGRASVAADFVGDGQNGYDCNGHGTHVAGTVGGATYGVAKNVSIHALRVLTCEGYGSVTGLVDAVNWVTANRINPAVVNMSVILSGRSNALDSAITNSIATGVTYAVAAGNNGLDACTYSPARVPDAITVGSVSSDDSRPPYSNQGACLDIYAPGNAILSLANWDDTSVRWMSGTSMASPHVAGVAALYLEANPSASPATVSQQILNAATTGKVTNTDGVSANRLLYSFVGGTQAPEAPARVTIIKQVIRANGGTSSTTQFGYTATNLGINSFSLVDTNAPPADRFDNPNVIPPEGSGGNIVVTEASLSGWNLNSIQCAETAGAGLPNIQNTTVELANRRAVIKVEQGETVTCTFTSQELAATAAPVAVSGRVLTDNGRGIKNVTVKVRDFNTGASYTTVTNSFGYYSVNGLLTTHLYEVRVSAKRQVFTPDFRTFTLSDNLSGMDFVERRK